MARFVTAREANQKFSEILSQAAAGEKIVITRRGEPVAELVPYRSASSEDAAAARARIRARIREGQPLGGEKFDRDALYDD